MIQHDMLLFDHGLPPAPTQSPHANLDVEYQSASRLAALSAMLADSVSAANQAYAPDYPTRIGLDMRLTDSDSFLAFAPAISIREARRVTEIGMGSNPHYHQPSDLYTTYSDADYHLGFTAVQTTLAAVATLAGLSP
jgi:hypothetical protein